MATKALDAVLDGEPSLDLSDIIHTVSPTPSPHLDIEQQREDAVSPEPLTEVEISQMRHRVTEMGLSFSVKGKTNANSREKELADMVLRLTGSTLLDPTQLSRQADAIYCLTAQRDFLLKQAEDERERWESEKDGWARMAEALLGRRNRSTSSTPKETDPDRQYYSASDNRILREKLHDTQARLHALESELVKLRPILLMQPSIPQSQSQSSLGYTSSFLLSVPFPSFHAAKSKLKKKKEVKSSRHSVPNPDEQEGSDSQTQIQTDSQPTEGLESSSFLQFQTQPVGTSNYSTSFTGDHYRKPNTTLVSGPLAAPPTTIQFQVSAPSASTTQMSPSNKPSPRLHPPPQLTQPGPSNLGRRKVRPKSRHPHGGSVPVTPLTSDARSEHLLLAARKIGRERAGIVAGYIRNMQREIDEEKKEQDRERERTARETERLDRERQERLPDRGAGGLSYYRTESMDATSASPKTPKRRTRSGGHYPNSSGESGVIDVMAIQSPQPLNPAFGFVDPRKTAGHSAAASRVQSTTIDASPATPRPGGSGSGSQSLPGKSTPLASLIDAARRMNHGQKGDPGQVNGGSRQRSVEAIDEPESPVPKRRKVGRRGSTGADRGAGGETGEEGPGLARMKSALDVLADQAAAAFSSAGNEKGKGKEKELAMDEGPEADMSVAPKAKRKVKATEKAREKAKLIPVRKPRVRAPPKERKLAPAPSANINPASSAGKAAPRMISPPRPRPFSTFGVASTSSERASPVDMLPPTNVVHPPPKEVQSSDVQPRPIGEVIAAPVRPNSRFGFGPVTRWDGSGSDEEGERSSSSPLRGGDKSASGREERQQEQVSEASRPEEEMEENLSHNNSEKESDAEMVLDAARSTEDPSPESGTGEDTMVTRIVVEEVGVRVDPDEFSVERRLRDEEPDVDRQNISMGLDKPSDVEQLPGLDGTETQRDIDMGPVDRPHSMENDEPNPENEAEAELSTGAVSGHDQRPPPAPSQTRNSATSPPSVPDPPCQYPDTNNPPEDTDADADADADEDVDAEGEADADGDVDPDAEGDVDLGAESTFSGLASDTLFMDIGAIQPAEYTSSYPTLSSGLLNAQSDKTQLDCANGISGTEDFSSHPTSADKRFKPGDRHS